MVVLIDEVRAGQHACSQVISSSRQPASSWDEEAGAHGVKASYRNRNVAGRKKSS